ncbi:hypothetical protein CHS0354_002937 [Potamilus streckersoni]|uniref:Hexosyltransferase n=1 Tax=Potamilus streckersoni TaxID=2493646 RepID=A0AAE0VH51_9BIVA|nr:hypothetical protein CHS0354_002937 [Potamilus streckersoni]
MSSSGITHHQRKQSLISLDIATTTIFPDKDKIGIYTRENIKIFTKLLLTNGDICTEKRIDIIIYIQSHWINIERRRSLRETWVGAKSITDIIIKSFFILGKPSNRTDQVKINNENLIHRDIVQGDFIESFQNITLKSIIALEWIYTHCRQAEIVLKADDDIFVDIFKVVNKLLPQLKNKSRNIVCSVKEDNTSPIVRDSGSKWYIPEHIFPKRTHLPRFCTGYFVVMTSDLVPELTHASEGAIYIPVDDVYLFGLLAQTLSNVTYNDISTSMTVYDNVALDVFSKGKDSHLMAGGASKDVHMAKIWMEVLVAQNQEKH